MAEKILIVDDDVDTLKLIGMTLQRHGYEIAVANSGRQGLARAAAELPDIILLDIMMPDMDGYEVTRRLRAEANLAHIPVIMFSAKSLVDDKVAGFEAGADDYLVKPTHPAELTSRVKALLQRASTIRGTAPLAVERARTIGFLGAKGGLGTTTLALNVAVALAQAGEATVVADLRPGQGTMGLLLGLNHTTGMGTLLAKTAAAITSQAVEGHLMTHVTGLRLLLSSPAPDEAAHSAAVAQAEQIVRHLAGLCKCLVLDLGAGLSEMAKRVASMCDALIVAVEPQPVTLTLGKNLLAALESAGINRARLHVALLNRQHSGLQTTWEASETTLGMPIGTVFTPAPELAYHAAESATPLLMLQPDSLTSQQIRQLARQVTQKPKTGPLNAGR